MKDTQLQYQVISITPEFYNGKICEKNTSNANKNILPVQLVKIIKPLLVRWRGQTLNHTVVGQQSV